MKRITTVLAQIGYGTDGAWQRQYDLGTGRLNKGEYREALDAYKEAIKCCPERSAAYLGAAKAYAQMGDFTAALDILKQGYERDPDTRYQNYQEAVRISVEEMMKAGNEYEDPMEHTFSLSLAEKYYWEHHSRTGINEFEFFDLSRSGFEYYEAVKQLEKGEYQEASIAFEKAISSFKNAIAEIRVFTSDGNKLAEAYLGATEAYAKLGNDAKAFEALRHCYGVEKAELGMECLGERDPQKAQEIFKIAIRANPQYANAYLGIAETYIASDDIAAAVSILEEGYHITGSGKMEKRLAEIRSRTFKDFWRHIKCRSGHSEDGTLMWYYLYTYDKDGRALAVTSYDGSGNQTNRVVCEWNEEGRLKVDFRDNEDGNLQKVEIENRDDDSVRKSIYEKNGEMIQYEIYRYNIERCICKRECYSVDGKLLKYYTYCLGEDGVPNDLFHYDGKGGFTCRVPVSFYTTKEYDGEDNLLASHATDFWF